MLKKLLKYEFKAMGRSLLPIYGAAVLMGIITAVFVAVIPDPNMEHNVVLAVTIVLVLVLFVVIVAAAIILSYIMAILRFKRNLLDSEGYIMNTLPVKTWQNIAAKLIAAVVYQILAVIAAGISIAVMILVSSNAGVGQIIADLGVLISGFSGITAEGWVVLLELGVMLLLSLIAENLMLYAAMSVGYSFNSHKVLCSVGTYIVFYIINQMLSSILLMPLLLSGAMNGGEFTTAYMHYLFLGVIGTGIVYTAAYFAVTNFMLKRNFNLQ